jgi:hypothetical protein
MHLSGQLTDWSINDLLQIMQVTHKTGSLDIEAERRGRVHFREGTVTGAELSGAKGSYVGDDRGGVADILYVLSTLTEGSFSVGPADGPEKPGWSVEDVMADVEALQSLEGEVVDAGLFEASAVRFVEDIEEPITLEPSDWAVLVSLVQPFTFAHLEARLGRGGAVRVFHTLHRLGVAETISDGDEESDWLDKLADDISPGSGEPTWLEAVTEDPAEDSADEMPIEEPAETLTPEPVVEASGEETVLEVVATEADDRADLRGVSAPASTTLTDGVYDEIRRLRSKVAEK